MAWRALPVRNLRREVNCTLIFKCGQAFGWRGNVRGEWTGVVGRHVVRLKQTPDALLFRCLNQPQAVDLVESLLSDYLQLNSDLGSLYDSWAGVSPRMRLVTTALPGLRVLRQDPLECLFSFLCSSNNHISRITLMLDRLRAECGELLHEEPATDAGSAEPARYFAFPTLPALAAITESRLRELGFGYRAKFVVQTAAFLQARGLPWLLQLRGQPHSEVREQLMQLCGVGRKVADCIALFSLDCTDVVPVDTHMWTIACRDLDRRFKTVPAFTPAVYDRVSTMYRDLLGSHAGWAHCVLFAAELPPFKPMVAAGAEGAAGRAAAATAEAGKPAGQPPADAAVGETSAARPGGARSGKRAGRASSADGVDNAAGVRRSKRVRA